MKSQISGAKFGQAVVSFQPVTVKFWVGRFPKTGFANGGANAQITDDCELVRICELGLGSGEAGSGTQVVGDHVSKKSPAALAHCEMQCEFRLFVNWCELRINNPERVGLTCPPSPRS